MLVVWTTPPGCGAFFVYFEVFVLREIYAHWMARFEPEWKMELKTQLKRTLATPLQLCNGQHDNTSRSLGPRERLLAAGHPIERSSSLLKIITHR